MRNHAQNLGRNMENECQTARSQTEMRDMLLELRGRQFL